MVACSASEVVNEIAKLQGLSQDEKELTPIKSRALVPNEVIPGEGKFSILDNTK